MIILCFIEYVESGKDRKAKSTKHWPYRTNQFCDTHRLHMCDNNA